MEKPQPKTRPKIQTALDYHECAEYIGKKLSYDLRDVAGKFKSEGDEDAPYLDFWHFLIERNDHITNGCYIFIGTETAEAAEEWQIEIVKAFVKEFGDNQKYWVEW